MKYAIRVEEIMAKTIIVDAESMEEAIEKVENACNAEDIIDPYEDFIERNVYPSDNFKNGVVSDEDVSFYEHLV